MKTQTSNAKSLKIFVIALLLSLFIIPERTFAQGPPPWAPAKGYRAKTRHIYFPQQNFYYDIQAHHYLYLNNGNWSISVNIPAPFININLGNVAQVQLDYYGANPYHYNTNHCTRYRKVRVYEPRHEVIVVKERNGHHHGKKHGHGKKHKHGRGHGHDD